MFVLLKKNLFCIVENLSSNIFHFVQVTSDVAQLLGEQKVDAILCVAGGWAGGNCGSKGQEKKSMGHISSFNLTAIAHINMLILTSFKGFF